MHIPVGSHPSSPSSGPLPSCRLTICRRHRTVPAHPDRFLYCGVLDGPLTASIANQPARLVAPGTSLVVSAGHSLVLHRPETEAPPIGVLLEVPPGAVEQLAAQLPPSTTPSTAASDLPYTIVQTPPALHYTLRALAAHEPDQTGGASLLDLMVAQVLVHLLATPARPRLLPSEETPPPELTAALQYLRRHLHRPPSVDELAEQACMSRSTFYRHFRSSFGVTPLQHLTRLRIERARALLRSPARTVTDVSLALGFGSVSHFIDTFKRHVGTTPKAYQHALQS